jgi:hypothetical protein
MKEQILNNVILKYLSNLNNSNWIIEEAYKFEFANYLQSNINFNKQKDEEILEKLLNSQKIKYDKSIGIQFILKSAKETPSEFISLTDIRLFREFRNKKFEDINWDNKTMSYTGLTAWLTSLFPNKIYPIPAKGFNETINYLFDTDLNSFPKTGKNYIMQCQDFLKQTEVELKKYPIEEIHLKVWNEYFNNNPTLNIKQKKDFDQIDWNWLVQDLHLFVYRNILKLYKPKNEPKKNKIISEIQDDCEPVAIEGKSKLAIHMRYERDNSLIKKIKKKALISNPMLNCEVCGFSFFEKYGSLGQGFIEAHHLQPLNETKETKTSRASIALVCSNCHKMIHKGISKLEDNKILTVNELKEIINKKYIS